MENLNFEGAPASPVDDEDGRLDDEFSIETDEGIMDPLELGHKEADKIIEEKLLQKYTEQNTKELLQDRLKNLEEDREEMRKTYQRF